MLLVKKSFCVFTLLLALYIQSCNNPTGNNPYEQIAQPKIISVEPNSSSIGSEVIIKGVNFGNKKNNCYVYFNEINAINYPFWSDTLIKVVIPEKVHSGMVKVKLYNSDTKKFSNEVSVNIDEDKYYQMSISAFDYLNEVRMNPAAFSKEIGDDLSYVKPRHKLNWNNTLAKVAKQKAEDMAKRNYLAHIDPDGNGLNIKIHQAGYTLIGDFLKTKNQNNFESIAAGYSSGVKAIQGLILDDNYPTNDLKGHRIHLLGIKDFWANCYDCGIGFAYNPNSNYGFYCCVIIAKHSW